METPIITHPLKCDQTKELIYKKPALGYSVAEISKTIHQLSVLTVQIPLTFQWVQDL